MEALRTQDLTFTYPNMSSPAVSRVSFSVRQGEFFLLFGRSGCGKTTLLRLLKPELAPVGEKTGSVFFCGKDLSALPQGESSAGVGFVGQCPEEQIVTDKVWHELAFGLENLGADTPTIRRRVAETASFFGIQNWFHKKTAELSGGQKQLLNLAAVTAMRPQVVILDEPTAQLDPIAASEFLSMLSKLNRELGITVILTEHRLEEAIGLADTLAFMEDGAIEHIGNAKDTAEYLRKNRPGMFAATPAASRVWASVRTQLPCPVTVREGRDFLREYLKGRSLCPISEDAPAKDEDVLLTAKELWFRYEKDGADILRGASLQARAGEHLCILGGNGSGKTTLLRVLAGCASPYRGSVKGEDVFLLPQDPKLLFIKNTVREELADALRGQKTDGNQKREKIAAVAADCGLEGLWDRHPYDLSGGEQQRAALAKLLLHEPRVLLLDEPTKGLDAQSKRELALLLRRLLDKGCAVVTVSHDLEFCAEYADRCAMFFDGVLLGEAAPRAFFGENSFYTTAACRIAKDLIPGAVLTRDVIEAIGGEPGDGGADGAKNEPPAAGTPVDAASIPGGTAPPPDASPSHDVKVKKSAGQKKRRTKKSVITAVILCLMIPATLLAAVFFLPEKYYYITAIAVLIEATLPFFVLFEGRRPRAREVVTLASLCAIGVAGRAALVMLPQFKPVLALTVIVGAAFGGEAGFLVGAVTMLVSNMLFSQGPWTPWQMFAMGLIGFLAGLVCRGKLRQSRLFLCLFGAFCAVIVYGGLMNPSTALLWGGAQLTWGTVMSYYATGFPLDLVHAAATVLFLWFGAPPMLEKLGRMKTKYGVFA
ncbi:MAG: ATP-binding cassette domain-containing protein [Clostridia bacterium]|nr:ATP-binding cassette domain-containing protein [Clostridia bacterium]